jgi:hypothetical protein
MALGNNSSAIYVDIRNGKIFRYSKTEQDGTTAVLNSKGEKKHYFIYDFIEGHVTGFSTREEDMQGNKKLVFQIHMTDGNDNYVVKMGVETAYFRMFCSVVPNIDFNYTVRLIPRLKEENGVKKSSMIVVNKDIPMKFAFTADNPNGKPQIQITKNKKGEIVDIDREEETQFFMNLINQTRQKLVHPAVSLSTTVDTSVEEKVKSPKKSITVLDEEPMGSDDLPF